MKYLINANFVAIRKGAAVEASAKDGEFIFDSNNQELKKAQLEEVAKANKIKIHPKLSTADIYAEIDEELSKMTNIPEQAQKTESQRVEEIVKAGHGKKSEDQLMVEIVQAGIGFKKVGKLYTQALEKLGLKVNTKDLFTGAGEILAAANFAPKTAEDVEAIAKKIAAEYPKAEIGQINQVIRRYAKANKIELPKVEKGTRGAIGFRKTAFDWMVANPLAKTADLVKFITEEKGKDEKVAKRYAEMFEFAKTYAKAASEPVAKAESAKAKA